MTDAGSPPGEKKAPTPEVILFDRGIAVFKVGHRRYVAVRRTCRALRIDPVEQLARLAAARWARLAVLEVPDHLDRIRRVAAIPWSSANMWFVGLDVRKVARRHRRWLEDLQEDATDLFLTLRK